MSESEIIQKLQEGNENAFRLLVENYQKLVVSTCYGMLHNMQDAEDIAQEVFIEVFRSVHKFRADSKLSTWLYRIAVNRSLNHIRDNKKHKWFQSFDDSLKSKTTFKENLVNTSADNPDNQIENSERAALLHLAIDNLPKNQKVAFTLSKYEDLSYQEISEVMDLTLSSVESLIHRAKKNLQKTLYTCYKKKCI
jgi:RNA polymerase sigma-70 factor (ECF subfamily)